MIHVVTPYGRNGPSSRVRVYEWLDRVTTPRAVSGYVSHHNASPCELARRPRAIVAAERRLRRIARDRPDTLLLHREASPLSRGAIERRLIASATFSVYDFDDALHLDHGEGGIVRRLAPKAPKALIAVRSADRVIAGNALLAEWACRYNRDVVVIPSCVAPDAYEPKTDYRVGDVPRIGWVGSADNEIYLQLIAPALREINKRTAARLTLIGTLVPRLGELERLIDRVAWSEQVQHTMLSQFDVGIAPVPDEPYTRGKCGYKILQYAAAGIPVVASGVGVNAEILSRLGMPAASDSADWIDAVVDLLTRSVQARAQLGRRARELTRQHYSYDAWLPAWLQAVGVTPDGA